MICAGTSLERLQAESIDFQFLFVPGCIAATEYSAGHVLKAPIQLTLR